MYIDPPPESPAIQRMFQRDLDCQGFVMNASRLWSWRPELREAFTELRAQLTESSSLTRREVAVLACATATSVGDPYGALLAGAHLAATAGEPVAAAILAGKSCDGMTSREAALWTWSRKVVCLPGATLPGDVCDLRECGLTDREIFEATTFIALRLALSIVSEALGVQPDWQLVAGASPQLRAAIARNDGKAGD